MLALIEASQREAAIGAKSDISQLAGLMRATLQVPLVQPLVGRVEEIPSAEATERVLTAAPVEGLEPPRARPGLRTRAVVAKGSPKVAWQPDESSVTRVRLHFAGGRSVILEAVLSDSTG